MDTRFLNYLKQIFDVSVLIFLLADITTTISAIS